MVKIIYQQVTEDGKFVLGLEGLSSDTKPTGGVIADGSTFKETDTDAEYYLDTTWKVAKAGQMKNLPAVSSTDNGKVMKVAEGAWAVGLDNGLPVGFPEAGTSNAGKFVGFNDTTGAYEAKAAPSGGGAEKFVVTISDNAGITADKTFAEIKAAYDAGKDVKASIYIGFFEITFEAILSFVNADTAEFVGFVYSPLDTKTRIYSCYCYTGGGSDAWNSHTVVVEDFPSYSSSNNGQVLGVSSGDLAWVDVAPLIVTMESDGDGGLVGDKTFAEIATAANSNKTVLIKYSDDPDFGVYNVVSVYVTQEQGAILYQISHVEGSSIIVSEGAANDSFVLSND